MIEAISKEILIKAAAGDMEAFEFMYRASSKFVYNVAWRTVGNHEDAKEITQDVFVLVYKKMKGFRFESSFKTWLYRVTVNSALNYSKKIATSSSGLTEFNEAVHGNKISSASDEKVEQEQKEFVINELLSKLPQEQRTCVVLRNLEGLSYQEISDVLRININTVRSRLNRARQALLLLGKEGVNNEL